MRSLRALRRPNSLALAGLLLLLVAGTASAREPATTTYWTPAVKTSWQIQFSGKLDTSVNAQMYDVDLFDTSTATVTTLHAKGRKVICYFSAGSWEDWRPDAAQFPESVKGNGNGWPGERWLDARQLAVLGPIMEARLDLCKSKGFDGADPDNVDGYTNDTGFPLSAQDQLAYNRFLAAPRARVPLAPAPGPRRFAQGMAAAFQLAAGLLLLAGFPRTSWLLQAALVLAFSLLLFARFCLGAYVFHVLRGEVRFANSTLPWARGEAERSV